MRKLFARHANNDQAAAEILSLTSMRIPGRRCTVDLSRPRERTLISNRDLLVALVAISTLTPAARAVTVTDTGSIVAQVHAGVTTNFEGREIEGLPCGSGRTLSSLLTMVPDPSKAQIVAAEPINSTTGVPLADGVYSSSTGVDVQVSVLGIQNTWVSVEGLCISSSGPNSIVVKTGSVPGNSFATLAAVCPPGQYVLGGGFNRGSTFALGNYPSYSTGVGLPNLADGTYPPADQWELSVQNTRSTPATMRVSAFCFAAPEARLLVSSTSLAPGETRGFDVSIPINWTLLGGGIATGRSANMFGSAAWRVGFGYSFMRSANIGAPPPGGAFMTMVTDTRTPGSSSTAPPVRQGAIVIPSNIATVPVTTATVREFVYPGGHSQGLSWLYFMTSNPQEQTDLMTGVHPGWNSTGRSFNWYAAGSGGPIDRRPFCRYYELMGASHFFSNNPYECALVLDKFSDHWGLESGEVGQVQVPDATTGMCPSNTVPVMRFWNGGQPIGPGGAIVQNHEYVISPSVASQRTMEHWINEGVVFCAQ